MEMQKQGDVYLLCSDGLCGMITDTEIETIISNSEDIESGANALVQSANDHGGKDNITVVLAKF
jgi:protein phosphatase